MTRTPTVQGVMVIGRGPDRRGLAAVLALAGMTLIAVVSVSLPVASTRHVAGGVGAARREAVWVVNAYLAASVVAAPLASRLADRVGRRRACLGCVAGFTIATALCGTATSLAGLIAARLLQGLLGGILVPLAQASLADLARPGRPSPLAGFSIALLIGPAFGPAIGGWLTDAYSWRVMFLAGVPVGLFALAVCARWLPDDAPERSTPGRFDWVGATLLVVGLACLEIVLTEGQVWDWFESRTVVVLSAGAAVALAAVAARCLWGPDPLIRLDLLRDRHFLACVALGAATTCVYVGSLSVISRMVVGLMGYAAANVAELVAPAALTLLVLVPVLAAAAGGAGGRLVPVVGLVTLSGGALWLSAGNLLVAPSQVLWPRAVIVVGMTLTLSAVNAAALRGFVPSLRADAASVYNLFRNLGASVGVCLVTVAGERGLQARLSRLTEAHLDALNPAVTERLRETAARFLPGPAAGDPVTADFLALKSLDDLRQQQAQGLAYFDTLLLCGVAAAALIPLIFLLDRRRVAQRPG
ncbi:DHA2 family efflux MFS transporter permease subunit [Singulisphaera sp. Ch08]|uniref:DHA2 family efflux MFS transporter permease subunit n=1 Tax=Singulisphaera sp. Ch08 TaxID=3120278 RepID=A0AAU7CBJ1_9BACT